jgi:NAD(P)H-nitrite reductase large subunit
VAAEGEGTAMAGLRLADGRLAPVKALFVAAGICPASPLAEELGCAFDDGPFGPLLRVDGMKQTSVTGVYAGGRCRDRPAQRRARRRRRCRRRNRPAHVAALEPGHDFRQA